MPDDAFRGPADVDRAREFLVEIENQQRDALEIDDVIDELRAEFEKSSDDVMYSASNDFILRLSSYLRLVDESATASRSVGASRYPRGSVLV